MSTHLKGNSLIWFCGQKQVLPTTIRGFNALFISRHETMPGSDSFSDLWVINLMEREKKKRYLIDLSLTSTATSNIVIAAVANSFMG